MNSSSNTKTNADHDLNKNFDDIMRTPAAKGKGIVAGLGAGGSFPHSSRSRDSSVKSKRRKSGYSNFEDEVDQEDQDGSTAGPGPREHPREVELEEVLGPQGVLDDRESDDRSPNGDEQVVPNPFEDRQQNLQALGVIVLVSCILLALF